MTPHPSFPLLVLGGLVGTVLLSALLHLVPVLGGPFIDYPRLLGGVLTPSPATAFWLGQVLFFLTGVLFLTPFLALAWLPLPGDRVQFRGAVVKGVLWGSILSVMSGLLLPVLGAFNQLTDPAVENPGLFGHELGLVGAVELLAGHVLYATALALVAAMGRGFSPFDTIGWMWTSHGTG